MRFDIITIFPEIFSSYFQESILGRAQKSGAIEIAVHNLRDYAIGKHRKVDDTPYGGGAGMVMQVEPIFRCVESIKKSQIQNNLSTGQAGKFQTNPKSEIPASLARLPNRQVSRQNSKLKSRVILFSAKGKRYTQEDAKRLLEYDNLILICGRYEGVDERVAKYIADEEISIGDYVLTGGEIPAMVVVDSVARLIPGVLGNTESAKLESHKEAGYLEHPQYSKPEDFQGWKVPKVLLSGNHGEIEKWQKKHSKKAQK